MAATCRKPSICRAACITRASTSSRTACRPTIVEGLKKIGHKTTSVVGPLGGGQAIWIDWDKGTLVGGSDPRKDGCALGY